MAKRRSSKPVATQEIRIRSFNPYAARIPASRVISRDTLLLIKQLRMKGISVIVEPEDGSKLHIVTIKGIQDAFANPVFMYLLNIPTSLVLGIISTWAYERLKDRRKNQTPAFVLQSNKDGRIVRVDECNRGITSRKFASLKKILTKRQAAFAEAEEVLSSDQERPIPIYLEHTNTIVGWGNVIVDKAGLLVENAFIEDERAKRLYESGALTGFSIAGLAYKLKCTICECDYTECNHIAGQFYDEVKCAVEITGIHIAEISMVRKPINLNCVIETVK